MHARKVLVAFGGLAAISAAGYGVLFTVLDDYRAEYGVTEGALGAIIGIGFVSAFLAQVLLGPLADRGHARRIVVIGTLANILGVTLLAFSTSFLPLLLGRAISGFGYGMAMPAIRRIVILADPDRLGHNLGRLLSIDVAGFAVGPILSMLFVGRMGIAAPFMVVVGATLVLLPFSARVPVSETVVADGGERSPRFAFDLLRRRAFVGAVLLGCALWLMMGAFDAMWAVMHRDLGTSRWIANFGITLFALPLIVFGALGGRLAQRLGPFRVGTVGLLLGAAWMFSYGQAANGGLILGFAMIHAMSDSLTMSSAGVAAGMVVPADRQAGAQGVLGGFQTLMAGVMAPVAGLLYENYGRGTAYGVTAGVMVVFVALSVLLAGRAWGMRTAPATVPSARVPGDPTSSVGAPAGR